MVSRLERTRFAAWWWTIDRSLLTALLTLMLAGIILSLAASPPVASRLGLDPFYFVGRHVLYLIPALAVMLTTSFLSPRHIRRLAVIVFVLSLALVAATLHFGAEVKGARRWIVLLGINIQPSEFLKPAFVILIAWLFGESARRPEMPANTFALLLLFALFARVQRVAGVVVRVSTAIVLHKCLRVVSMVPLVVGVAIVALVPRYRLLVTRRVLRVLHGRRKTTSTATARANGTRVVVGRGHIFAVRLVLTPRRCRCAVALLLQSGVKLELFESHLNAGS